MKKDEPRVTVLLPVRNGAKWIAPVIHSLANQSHEIDELLVIDDGSTDSSLSIIRSLWKTKIRVVQGPQIGLGAALRLGVEEAENSYIARSDQDDISSRKRIEKQIQHLIANPHHTAVGSSAKIVRQGRPPGIWIPPSNPKQVARALSVLNPLVHSSIMFRKEAVIGVGNYQAPIGGAYPEDYDLWLRLNRLGGIANLRQPLVSYQVHEGSMSRVMRVDIAEASVKLALSETLRVLEGIPLGERFEEVISWINGGVSSPGKIKMSDLKHLTRLVGTAPFHKDSKNYFPRGILLRLQTRLLREKFKTSYL